MCFRGGESAGYVYDKTFDIGPNVPLSGLGDYTPQAVASWNNWDGGKDLLLMTAYK